MLFIRANMVTGAGWLMAKGWYRRMYTNLFDIPAQLLPYPSVMPLFAAKERRDLKA